MTVTISGEENIGRERVITDVIAYDVLCTDDIECIESALEISLSNEQKKEVARRCQKSEHFPNMEDLRWIVRDVYEGR